MISETDPVTVTLDFLSWQGGRTLLLMLGIAVATGLVWLMLNGSERRPPLTLRSATEALAWVLLPVWLWILAATLWELWLVFNGYGGPLDEGSLGLGALIAAALGAPFVIYGTWLRHKTNRLEQEGHMTDRITKAVEQLGADKTIKRDGVEESVPNIEVRMGAILSLERIAQDSTIHDKGRDHVRVMEILCAYIRENSPALDLKETPNLSEIKTPRTDIQFALNVIKRRSGEQIHVERRSKYRLDLRGCDLDGCDLSKGNFQGAILWKSRLEAADLRYSDFTGTQFNKCLLDYADLYEATLIGTTFNGARITRLSYPIIDSEKLRGVFIEAADVSGLRIGVNALGTKFFGSRETTLARHYENRKKKDLILLRRGLCKTMN